MINWERLQYMYERKAYRIVQRHIKKILSEIPLNNVSLNTYKILIASNITEQKIKEMFVELYTTIGNDYGKRVKKEIDKEGKQKNILFSESFLQDILLFLSTEGGSKITSVQGTLVEDIIKAIQEKLKGNESLVTLQNAIYELISKSYTFYKWQALRIARTETTSASNFASYREASKAPYKMTKVWIAALDDRTRHDHKIENGQIVDFEKPFTMADGSLLMYPGDTTAKASQVINCRCTLGYKAKRDKNGMIIFK
jgi:hypothetical protein